MVPGKLRPILLIAPAVLLLAGAVAGCGGDDNTSSTPTKAATSATTAATASGSAATGSPVATAAEIDQDGLAFKPNKVTVKVGEKILVKNSESALHTFDVDGKNLSGNMKKGATYVWTAAKAGEFKVTCDYHPQMMATITVQ